MNNIPAEASENNNMDDQAAVRGTIYRVELNEEGYIELMRLVLKHPDDISLLTRTCIAYAKAAD